MAPHPDDAFIDAAVRYRQIGYATLLLLTAAGCLIALFVLLAQWRTPPALVPGASGSCSARVTFQ